MDNSPLLRSTSLLVKELESYYSGWLGVDQFSGTAERVARMYGEFCWSPAKIKMELDKQFRTFENGYDEMLVAGPMTIWTLCPHHLLPVCFKCWIGYVPSGKVAGLSKLVRIADIMGKRPIMQEQYSAELAKELEVRLEPKGTAVYLVGSHGCMASRGVKQDVPIITSTLKGCLLEAEARSEFFSLVKGGNPCQ